MCSSVGLFSWIDAWKERTFRRDVTRCLYDAGGAWSGPEYDGEAWIAFFEDIHQVAAVMESEEVARRVIAYVNRPNRRGGSDVVFNEVLLAIIRMERRNRMNVMEFRTLLARNLSLVVPLERRLQPLRGDD